MVYTDTTVLGVQNFRVLGIFGATLGEGRALVKACTHLDTALITIKSQTAVVTRATSCKKGGVIFLSLYIYIYIYYDQREIPMSIFPHPSEWG